MVDCGYHNNKHFKFHPVTSWDFSFETNALERGCGQDLVSYGLQQEQPVGSLHPPGSQASLQPQESVTAAAPLQLQLHVTPSWNSSLYAFNFWRYYSELQLGSRFRLDLGWHCHEAKKIGEIEIFKAVFFKKIQVTKCHWELSDYKIQCNMQYAILQLTRQHPYSMHISAMFLAFRIKYYEMTLLGNAC